MCVHSFLKVVTIWVLVKVLEEVSGLGEGHKGKSYLPSCSRV